MNILKKIALSAAMVAAFATAPTFAAEEHGDKNAAVKAAATETVEKLKAAVAIAEGNGDKAAFIAAIGEVRQAQKEFRYEQTERLRQRLNDKLRLAREAADKGTIQDAGAATKEASAILDEMMGIYNAAHK